MNSELKKILTFIVIFSFSIGIVIALPFRPPHQIPNSTNNTLVKGIIQGHVYNKIHNKISNIRQKDITIIDYKRYDNLIFVKLKIKDEYYTHIFSLDKIRHKLGRHKIKKIDKKSLKRWLRG